MNRTLFTAAILVTAILTATVADAATVTYTLGVADPNGPGTWTLRAAGTAC